MRDRPLAGQHAVVTGGGRGIGAAIAYELAASGAAVTLMGRDIGRLEDHATTLRTEFDQEFHTAMVDVTQPKAVGEAFASARKAVGEPAILVNNAGAVETAPFVNIDPDHWRRMIDVNLTGVYLCCREALPAMIKAGAGRIVNVSSTAGVAGHAYVVAYAAAKHGVIGLTRSLALETAEHGVTVNAVCPGYTNTDLLIESAKKVAEKSGRSVEEVMETFKQANPHGRLVQPEEVAQKVGWLCHADQARTTGQAIVIDGSEL